uniref:FHA domain-containing protein n=1 Tax=Desulfatirhabdium butyrativorans TaxID=340467 RepID=A0A7C4RT22_9BACT
MPVLILIHDNKPLKLYELAQGNITTIGRMVDNDICIVSPVVSKYHAKVDAVGDAYILTDLKSRNGTYVNDRRIESKFLEHNDKILIGTHLLLFRYRDGEPRFKPNRRFERGIVLENHHGASSEDAAPRMDASLEAEEKRAVLMVLSGSGEAIPIHKDLMRIGKHPQSDIVVKGIAVGQTAATITRRPEGYFLSYIEGIGKPKVNGQTVSGSVQLNDFDRIDIGSLKLQFMREKKPA